MSEAIPMQSVLGQHRDLIDVELRDEVAQLSLQMANQCRRKLDIVSRHLDPQLYDNDEFCAAVKRLALDNRQARVRLFVVDARPLLGLGHRLIELANRLPSYIEIRAPAPQHKMFNEAYLLADNQGYIHRQFSDRFEAQVNFADRGFVTALRGRFDAMWERGVVDTRFRRLHI